MASLIIGVVLVITLYSSKAAQDFKSVSACPKDASSWKMSSVNKNCQGDTPDYLCAAIENEPGILGEICTKHGLTPAKKCAVLNQQTKNLDSVDCKAPSRCPDSPYSPSELWKHEICFEDFYGTTSTAAVTKETTTNVNQNSSTNATKNGPDTGGSGAGAEVAVVVVLLIICIIVVILVVFYRKDQFGFKQKMQPHIQVVLDLIGMQGTPGQENATTDVENPDDKDKEEKKALLHVEGGNGADEPQKQETAEYAIIKKPKKKEKAVHAINEKSEKEDKEKQKRKLKELLKYPVHILKGEVEVKDLKEKIVIHSKSIKAHFTAVLIAGLQRVQHLDDYNRLDISVVFTLLQNFCENIKPPSKGWDYEPPSDEITVGADIERIRLMWNRFCDDDDMEFPQLDDVNNRMRQKYGTVAVLGDDGAKELHREDDDEFAEIIEKIPSIKLNPDCVIEEGIVITDNIKSAKELLQKKKVVILIGVIGCGKSYALKAIENHLNGKGSKTVWIQENKLLAKENFPTETILLCDNFFGRFGSHAFSKNYIQNMEKSLEDIQNGSTENKVVIGIHRHVFEDVKKTCPQNFFQNKNYTIDMDKLTEAETLLIFREQRKQGHCKEDSACWFREIDCASVLLKLSKSPGQVGSPFLSLMYCHHHELFSNDDFTKSPVQSLLKHFNSLREGFKTTYFCLVYLMCVQNHKLDQDPKLWAGFIDAEINKNTINNLNKQKPGYIQIEQQSASMLHDILTIVLLKSALEIRETVDPVLRNCREDILLELLRPPFECSDEFFCSLADEKKGKKLTEQEKGIVYRLAQYPQQNQEFKDNPLPSIGFFKEKYLKYSSKPPKSMRK